VAAAGTEAISAIAARVAIRALVFINYLNTRVSPKMRYYDTDAAAALPKWLRRRRKSPGECKVTAVEAAVVITHPNRDTPETNMARMIVIALFGISIVLMLAILAFGWSVLEGMMIVSFGYIISYAIIIWRVSDWARGPLALGAALAILLAIFSGIAFPTWSDRDGPGYAEPQAIWGGAGLSPGVLGLLTMILAVLQIGLIVACIRAFRQEWQVEVEMSAATTAG
jgi:hypothetical protein